MAGVVIGPGDGERFTFLGTDVTGEMSVWLARASGDERDRERRAQIERDFGMTRHGPPPGP
jgi:hypothetical protein